MKITGEKLRSIIQEEVASHRLQKMIREMTRDAEDLRERVNKSPVYLVEGSRQRQRVRSISFGALMESIDKRVITEEAAFRIWEGSVDYQMRQFLTESMMDDLKSAYETVKGGAIKIKDKISSVASAAWEKANDFILKISIQAINMATKSVSGIVSAARKLASAVERFREDHPILFKIIMIIVIMLIVFGIMSLFGGEAQAAVKAAGGKGAGGTLSEPQYEALRGALDQYGSTGGMDQMIDTGEAIKALDAAYKGGKTVDMNTLGKFNQGAWKVVQGVINDAKGGDSGAWELLQKWGDVGSKLVVR